MSILSHVANKDRENMLGKARISSHGIYKKLNHEPTYVAQIKSVKKVRWIMKARAGMIGLNDSIWRVGDSRICAMCNLREEENIAHFMGRCPCLKEFRIMFFGEAYITEDRVVEILNGDVAVGWNKLFGYLMKAWYYRKELVAEFNY